MRLHVRVHHGGDREPPVVLVHGSMDRGAAFARVAARLAGRTVVRYDRRGYGRSVPASGHPPIGIAGHADDLLAVIDDHAGGAAVVIGHSLGGDIALAAAGRGRGAVLAVGAYESPMPWEPWWPTDTVGGAALAAAGEGDDAGAAERFLRGMLGDERWDALGPVAQSDRRAEGPALVAELRSVWGPEPPYDLAAVAAPVRAARGSRSTGHHRRAAEALAGLVGMPDGPDLVDGALHGAHLSHPAGFAAWIERVSRDS